MKNIFPFLSTVHYKTDSYDILKGLKVYILGETNVSDLNLTSYP